MPSVILGMGEGSDVTSTNSNNDNVDEENVDKENEDVDDAGVFVAYNIRGTNVM